MKITPSEMEKRIRTEQLFDRIISAEVAAQMIKNDMIIGVSGFTPSGYPKAIPEALAKRVTNNNEKLKISLYSGASVGEEIDGLLSEAGIISRRMPYQTNTSIRKAINNGIIDYVDMHLSHSTQYVNYQYMPKIDIAVVEAAAITEEGHIIPTLSIGNTPAFIKNAEKVIVEINTMKPLEIEGMADIYLIDNPPNRDPIPLTNPGQRIGTSYIPCGLDKIAGIVFTQSQDKTNSLTPIDELSMKISINILKFLNDEVDSGRLPANLLPIQSGVGSVANAVLYGLCQSEFKELTCYTEVIQDSMLELIRNGKVKVASTTAISLSPKALEQFETEIGLFKDKIILRPQEISNNPEIIRRLGTISMNTALELDIYGNVNSTHVMGTQIMNGIGGSGDFARNAYLSIFTTASTAKEGKISSIVPMVSHVDHTEHDVMIIVTEQGVADLRGKSPKERAFEIIDKCAHPNFKIELFDYFDRACAKGGHTPHVLNEALSWHEKYINFGTMKSNA